MEQTGTAGEQVRPISSEATIQKGVRLVNELERFWRGFSLNTNYKQKGRHFVRRAPAGLGMGRIQNHVD